MRSFIRLADEFRFVQRSNRLAVRFGSLLDDRLLGKVKEANDRRFALANGVDEMLQLLEKLLAAGPNSYRLLYTLLNLLSECVPRWVGRPIDLLIDRWLFDSLLLAVSRPLAKLSEWFSIENGRSPADRCCRRLDDEASSRWLTIKSCSFRQNGKHKANVKSR